jgi:hypothetical protein
MDAGLYLMTALVGAPLKHLMSYLNLYDITQD